MFFAGGPLVSAGEKQIAGPARDFPGDPLPPCVVARLGSTRLWHKDTQAIFLSPQGKTLATLSIGFGPPGRLLSRICKWDVATGKLLQEKRLPQQSGNSFNVSRDSAFAARYIDEGKEQRLVVWDLAQDTEINGPTRELAHSSITFQTVLADRKTLIYRDNGDRRLVFWDIAAKKVIKRLGPVVPPGERFTIEDALLSRDGKRAVWFLKSSKGEFLQVVDEGRNKPLLQRDGSLIAGMDGATLSPDGQYLAWSPDYQTFHILDLAGEKDPVTIQTSQTSLRGLIFSPDGKLLACEQIHWSKGRSLKLWDVAKQRFLTPIFLSTSPRDWFTPVTFSADSKTLAVSADGAARIYDTAGGKERLRIAGHRASVNHLHFSSDGRSLISRDGGVVCRWQREQAARFGFGPSLKIRPCLETAHLFRDDGAPQDQGDDVNPRPRIRRPAYALDATRKVNESGIVLDMTGSRPRKISRLEFDKNDHYRQGFVSPDNRRVLLYRHSRRKQDPSSFDVFDATNGKRLARWPTPESLNAAFSADGRLFVWQERERGALLLGDLQTGERRVGLSTDLSRKPFRGAFFNGSNSIDKSRNRLRFDRLTVSLDNRRVAAVWNSTFAVSAEPGQMIDNQEKEPTTLYVWDVASGKETARIALQAPKGKMPQLTCLSFLPDGRTLAAGYLNDSGVHLLEIASGKERAVLHGHQGTVRSLALSPEGRYLLSGSDDTTILVWDLDQLKTSR